MKNIRSHRQLCMVAAPVTSRLAMQGGLFLKYFKDCFDRIDNYGYIVGKGSAKMRDLIV
jgi:hypothetical protein